MNGSWRVVLGSAVFLLAAGCGNLTSGGLGEVEVFLSVEGEEERAAAMAPEPTGAEAVALQPSGAEAAGLEPTGAEAARLQPSSAEAAGLQLVEPAAARPSQTAPAPRRSSHEPIIGTLTVEAQVLLGTGRAEEWVAVTDGFEDVVLDLEDPVPVLVSARPVPATTYSGVRTVFGRVVAEVEGLVTSTGDTITGEVEVQLGNGRIVVDEPLLEVEVRDRGRSEVVVELNPALWLRLVDAAQRQVREADFRNAVRIRAQ